MTAALRRGCLRIALAAAAAVAASMPPAIAQSAANTVTPAKNAPAAAIPDGPMGDAIRYGEKVVTETGVYAKRYVGNGLNCTSCHLDGGKMPFASPWIGIWGVFPEYFARSGKVDSLQERINQCFQRSMNGRAAPEDSKEMIGMLAYMWWLSRDIPTGVDGPGRGFETISLPAGGKADPAAGKALYAAKCAECHGAKGEGVEGADGRYAIPPLWGPKSFNAGAGMARVSVAAAFIKVAMPLGLPNTLTDQQAFDLAAYITRQARPDFRGVKRDWPRGDRPADARE